MGVGIKRIQHIKLPVSDLMCANGIAARDNPGPVPRTRCLVARHAGDWSEPPRWLLPRALRLLRRSLRRFVRVSRVRLGLGGEHGPTALVERQVAAPVLL